MSLGGALGLGASRVARVVAAEIERALGRPARVLAIGRGLARELARAGLPVIAVVDRPRRRRREPPMVQADPLRLPFGEGSFDALCSAGLPVVSPGTLDGAAAGGDGPLALIELARVLRDGGWLGVATAATALVRKVAPPEALSGHFLRARLLDLEQQEIGATLLTTGRVRRFPGPGATTGL